MRLYSVYYISAGSSTCFGCWHPSSGARTIVITAFGTGHLGLLPSALVVELELIRWTSETCIAAYRYIINWIHSRLVGQLLNFIHDARTHEYEIYFLVYLFQLLYMFRATVCPSSGELTVSMRPWHFSLCIGGCFVKVLEIWLVIWQDERSFHAQINGVCQYDLQNRPVSICNRSQRTLLFNHRGCNADRGREASWQLVLLHNAVCHLA